MSTGPPTLSVIKEIFPTTMRLAWPSSQRNKMPKMLSFRQMTSLSEPTWLIMEIHKLIPSRETQMEFSKLAGVPEQQISKKWPQISYSHLISMMFHPLG